MTKKYEYKVKEPEQKSPVRIAKRPDYSFNEPEGGHSGRDRKLLIGAGSDIVFYYLGFGVLP